jgi:hypothetical protein
MEIAMLIVFTEATTDKSSLNTRELASITEAARLFGCRVYTIPPNFDKCETAENALAYVPEFDSPQPCIWIGFIPSFERYEAIYLAAQQKNIFLVNNPEQHRRAMEFDQFYPMLHDLTAKSLIIQDLAQLSDVEAKLHFPVFVKGAVKSNKEGGWNAVVANNLEELYSLATTILQSSYRSRDKVIVRELLKLKTVASDSKAFPISHEYRAFVYQGKILAYGFYWDEYNEIISLTSLEKQSFVALITEAARRVEVPFVAVDIAQLESGGWKLIEIGDAQFCGLSQIPVLELWSKLKDISFPI